MSTKAVPGPHDDYGPLAQDEEYFVLVAKREGDSKFVRMWAAEQRELGNDGPKVDDSFNVADRMDAWRDTHSGASTADQVVLHAFRQWHAVTHPNNITFVQCQEQICLIRKRALQEIAALTP
jgi:hypothetical protein